MARIVLDLKACAGESAANTLSPLSNNEPMEGSHMPTYQQITSAREKAKRIREYAVAFRRDRSLVRIAEIQFETLAKKNIQPSKSAESASRKSQRSAA